MRLTKKTNILIVGLGLLGGSYARALKAQGYCVYALTGDDASLQYALAHGIIDAGSSHVEPLLCQKADLVIFCLYPHVFLEWIEKYQHLLKHGAILTDVTGVKGEIVGRIQSLLRSDLEFIAAHPMAGRESSGVENSNTEMFRGANYIVVPTEKNTKEAISLCRQLGEILGFRRVSELSPERHDAVIAYLSQLTHCIAISLMCTGDTSHMEEYTGDSFRDLTRIAKINDEMWSELFLYNREALIQSMDAFRASFDTLYDTVLQGDREGMRTLMRRATEERMRFDKPTDDTI